MRKPLQFLNSVCQEEMRGYRQHPVLGDKAIPTPCETKSPHFGEQIWGTNTNWDDTNLGGSFYC